MRQNIKELLKILIFFIGLSSFSSCESGSVDLTIGDTRLELFAKKTNFKLIETYSNGNYKRLSYPLGENIIELSFLESGYIYNKKTFYNSKLIDEIKSNQFEWNYENLYEVDLIVEQYIDDTLNIWIYDNSYVWFDDYVEWKSDFFIYENYKNLKTKKIVKTRLFQDGKEKEQDFVYTIEKINEIQQFYSINDNFKEISSLFLRSFEPTEIFSLRNAHVFFNDAMKDYELDFVSLLYEFSKCKKDCFAEKRLRLISEMLGEVKLDDFWTDNRIEPDNFIKKINEFFVIMEKELK